MSVLDKMKGQARVTVVGESTRRCVRACFGWDVHRRPLVPVGDMVAVFGRDVVVAVANEVNNPLQSSGGYGHNVGAAVLRELGEPADYSDYTLPETET